MAIFLEHGAIEALALVRIVRIDLKRDEGKAARAP